MEPDLVIGQSVGEIAAAHLAGARPDAWTVESVRRR
nr:hypothetical protein [Salinispora arenicola]